MKPKLVFAPAATAQMMDDQMMSTSMSTASVSATAMMGDHLPRTGGPSLVPALMLLRRVTL